MPKVRAGLLGRAHVGFTHDLDQGNPGPIEVDCTDRQVWVVRELSRILLHMDPCNANALSLPVYVDENVAVLRNREFILGYLVSLWKIRVEVILSGKATFMGNVAIGGQRHAKGIIHYLAVQDRKYSRHTQAYRACVCIWRCAELRGATTKDLGLRQELGMDFKPDNGFIGHVRNTSYSDQQWCDVETIQAAIITRAIWQIERSECQLC